MNQTEETRKYTRYRCEYPLWIIDSELMDGEYQLAEVHNISTGGLFFISQGPLQVGQVLELCVEIPEGFQMLTLHGRVKHICQQGEIYHCGLEFEEEPDPSYLNLFQSLQHQMTAALA